MFTTPRRRRRNAAIALRARQIQEAADRRDALRAAQEDRERRAHAARVVAQARFDTIGLPR